MKAIVINSGEGGKDFINKAEKKVKMELQFVKPFNDLISHHNKDYVRENLLRLLYNMSKKHTYIIIASHSGSSCILDILIKNNFTIYNIKIFEPIIPMCLYIREKNYRNILILSTTLTEKIRWHYRLLHSNKTQIKYITFPLLAKSIENHDSDFTESIRRLTNQKVFLQKCDCVVLGCTHYNIIKGLITEELKTKYNFSGDVLDSNDILMQYLKSKIK
jgi:glutamate racemase